MNAADFPRAFATAYGNQDAENLALLFSDEGSFHMITGLFVEGRDQIVAGALAEFSGLSRAAKLVSGKTNIRPIGPGASILHQRYVVTGLRDEAGNEMPRVGALLTAVLAAKGNGWLALTATFAVVES